MSEENTSTSPSVAQAATPGATPPTEAAPVVSEPAKASANKDLTFPDQETLNARLTRFHASQLKGLGIGSPEELKAQLAEFKELKAAEESRAREAMTVQEQLASDLKTATAARESMSEQMDQMKFESHVKGICAEMGVTNVDYALYEVARAAEKVAENEQLDVREHLSSLSQKDNYRAALGLPATAQVVENPATTTPALQAPNPNSPASNGAPNALNMSNQEFANHLNGHGASLTG